MMWLSLWLAACNFLAFALFLVIAILLLSFLTDDRNK